MNRRQIVRWVASLLILSLILPSVPLAGLRVSAAADPVINEFVFNHTGNDTCEYIEAFGEANTDYSAFKILQIGGDGTGAGTIDSILDIGQPI